MNTTMKSLTTFAAAFALLAAITATAQPYGRGRAAKALTPEARQALVESLAGPDGEYAAHAAYSAVIAKFGELQPYANIREAEARHIAALERQLEKYGVPLPANEYAGKVKAPDSPLAAAKDEVKAEERNVALYDRLFIKVKAYPDLTRVFTNLRRASQENHLPAFKSAVENGGRIDNYKGGSGPGQGRGRGAKSALSIPTAPASAPATVVVDADKFLQLFGSAGVEEQSRVGKAAQAIRGGELRCRCRYSPKTAHRGTSDSAAKGTRGRDNDGTTEVEADETLSGSPEPVDSKSQGEA